MHDVFTVSFFGHRHIENFFFAENRVYKIIGELIRNMSYVYFLVGRDGDFDQIVSSSIIRAKKKKSGSNICHTCVLPYERADFVRNITEYEKYYDDIEICEVSNASHPKAAFQIRNRIMVERSDFIVFFVKEKRGGAFGTMQYAAKLKRPFINLAEI